MTRLACVRRRQGPPRLAPFALERGAGPEPLRGHAGRAEHDGQEQGRREPEKHGWRRARAPQAARHAHRPRRGSARPAGRAAGRGPARPRSDTGPRAAGPWPSGRSSRGPAGPGDSGRGGTAVLVEDWFRIIARCRGTGAPRSGLVEHDPQAVDVGADVDVSSLAAGLLGAHVGRGAQDLAVGGQGRLARRAGRARSRSDVGPALRRRSGCSTGLRSRWMIPASWACSSASATRRQQLGGSRDGGRGPSRSRSAKRRPRDIFGHQVAVALRSDPPRRSARCPGG